jgi:pimeloyl-ACP methyl ester carboxylesterase
LISPVAGNGSAQRENGHHAVAGGDHSPKISTKQVESYQRLTSDDSGAVGPIPFSSPANIPSRYSTQSSTMSHSSSFAGGGGVGSPAMGSSMGSVGSVGSMRGGLFIPKSSALGEQEIEPTSLADPDSLFVTIDSLIVHYKLTVNGRPVVSGRDRRTESGDFEIVPKDPERGIASSAVVVYDDAPTGIQDGSSSSSAAASSTLPSPPQSSYFDSASAATSSAFSSTHQPNSSGSTSVFHSPLVFMHGFGSSLFCWRSVWRELSGFSPILLAFDRPGFGLTSRPIKDPSTGSFGTWIDKSKGGRGVLREQENPYTQEYSVKLLFKLLTTLGLDQRKSVLVAHSTGGAISVRAAIERPELVSGCFLVSPHLFTAGFPSMLKSLLKTKLGKMITQQLVRSELGEVALKRAWFNGAHIPADALTNYQRILRVRGQMEALLEIAQTAPKSDDPWVKLSERMGELAGPNRSGRSASNAGRRRVSDEEEPPSPAVGGTPVCILHGIQDKLVDVSESVKAWREMRSDGVNVTLVKIDHCGHVPHEEFPSVVIEHLHAFLRDMETPQQATEQQQPEDALDL